jgi:hypothetical protein
MRKLIAAGALLAFAAASAGPASAATIDVSNLPDAVTIAASDRIDVTDSRTLLCGSGDLSVYVPGRRDAVAVSNVVCSGATLNATITPTDSAKTKSVVKFRLRKPDGSVAMLTLVVRVDR